MEEILEFRIADWKNSLTALRGCTRPTDNPLSYRVLPGGESKRGKSHDVTINTSPLAQLGKAFPLLPQALRPSWSKTIPNTVNR